MSSDESVHVRRHVDDSMNSRGESATPPDILHPGAAQISVSRDLDEWSARAAELFITLAQQAADEEGNRFTVALSGGETPRRLYELLATRQYAGQIPWDRVHLFWGDERHVPPDDPESNYRMVREALLSRVSVPAENVHRVPTELGDADDVARAYENDLRGIFALQPDQLPRFDLVLLGLGPDGHTASLFPETEIARAPETDHLVAAPWVEKFSTHRITLTPPVLNNAATIAFLVAGTGKAGTVHAVLDGPRRPAELPAQLIAPTDGMLLWLLDAAAAGQLQRR